MKNLMTINENSETSISLVTEWLSERGMQVECSFDLRIARKANIECTCPHHGTEYCDCQIVVLLIYGEKPGPDTVVAHSQDGRTRFGLVNHPDQEEPSYLKDLFRELIVAGLVSR